MDHMSDTVYCTGSLRLAPATGNDASQLACHLRLQSWYSRKWRLVIDDGCVLLSCYWAPIEHDAIVSLASNGDPEGKALDGMIDMVDVISRTGETIIIDGDHVSIRPASPKIILAAIRAKELGWQNEMDAEYRSREETMDELVRLHETIQSAKTDSKAAIASSHVKPVKATARSLSNDR